MGLSASNSRLENPSFYWCSSIASKPSVFSSLPIMGKYIISLWAAHSAAQCHQPGETLRWNGGHCSSASAACKGSLFSQPGPPQCGCIGDGGVHFWLSMCTPGELLTARITLQLLGWVRVHTWMSEVWFSLSHHVVGEGRHSAKESPFLSYSFPYSLMQYRKGIDKKASALAELLRKTSNATCITGI